jgi:hypothetical protein
MKQIDSGIWYTGELLNPQECEALIAKAEAAEFKVARMKDKGRNNKETFVKCPETMQTILLRLSEQVSQEASMDFQVLRLGPVLECYRYEAGEFVTAHCDAPREIEPGLRSKYTLVIYLSDEIEGGDTVFPNKGIRVSPTQGRAVLFDHVIRHEGAKVLGGIKYIVRTDVAVSDLTSVKQSSRHKTSVLG